MDASRIGDTTEEHGYSKAAGTVAGALDDLDTRVAGFTGYTVNLWRLFPLSLAGPGIWRSMESGLMLEIIPDWILLCLALESFVKLLPTRAAGTGGPGTRGKRIVDARS